MSDYRCQWLIEVPKKSALTDGSDVVYVRADELVHRDGALLFSAKGESRDCVLAAFAPGQWRKVEITEAVMGTGNAIFSARGPGGRGPDGDG